MPFIGSTITVGDSAEFVTAAATFGIPHPSGYPLYVALAHAFTWIPFGTVAWRVMLFSAACAAAALALLFVLVRASVRLIGTPFRLREEAACALVLIALACSETWWAQAVYAKVYALQALLAVCTGLAFVRWLARGTGKGAWLVGLCFGLSCANHLFLAAASAPFLLFAGAVGLREMPKARIGRTACAAAGGVLAGLLPYVGMAAAVAAGPRFAFSSITGVAGFFRYVVRADYADIGAGAISKDIPVASYAAQLARELGLPIILLAVLGAIASARCRRLRPFLAWSAGISGVPVLVAVFQSASGWDPVIAYDYGAFALPSLALTVALAGVGAVVAANAGDRYRKSLRLLAWSSVVAVAAVGAINAYPAVAAYRNPFVDAQARRTLAALPRDAVLVNCKRGKARDTAAFALSYLQVVEDVRTDVTVVDGGMMTTFLPKLPEAYARMGDDGKLRTLVAATLLDPALRARPVFTLCAPEALDPGFRSVAFGTAFEVLRDGVATSTVPATDVPPYASAIAAIDFRSVVADALYLEAARLVRGGDDSAASAAALEARRIDPYVENSAYHDFMTYRAFVRGRLMHPWKTADRE